MPSDRTTNLALPYIAAAQAQKHVTHNEALRALDALVQLCVLDRNLAAPPANPADGDRYIVAAAANDAWSGRSDQIAAWQDGAWTYFAPRPGWVAWVADENALLAWTGSSWTTASSGGGSPSSAPQFGINATADTTNRLAVKSAAVLFDNVGAGQQTKINKAAATDTASLLFQSNYAGRAEFGLAGNDDFSVKVSPDGTTWAEAIRVDRTTGRVLFPAAPIREVLAAHRTYYVRTDGNNANTGLVNAAGGALLTVQRALDVIAGTLDLAGYTATIAIAAGTFAGQIVIPRIVGQKSAANLVITGAGSSSTVLTSTGSYVNATVFAGAAGAMVTLSNLRVQNTAGGGAGCAINAENSAQIVIGNGIDIGTTSWVAVRAANGGFVQQTGAGMSFSADGNSLFGVQFGGSLTLAGLNALGTRACNVVADATSGGIIAANTASFSGTVTGKRYIAESNGVIATYGAGATHFPGSVAGTTASGGQYF